MVLSDRINLPDRLHDVIRPLNTAADAIDPILDMIGDELLFLRAECGCDGLERLGRVASQDKLLFQYRPLAGIFLVASH